MSTPEIEERRKDPDKFERIELYKQHLEKKIKEIEIEISLFKNEINRMEYELRSTRAEIERLSELPLLSGYIIDVLDNYERAIIDCPPSANYVVSISNRLEKEKVIPGTHVGLNQRNYAVIEILPSYFSPFIRGMEILDKNINITYGDIGGLDEQILEVREIIELPLKKPELFKKVGIKPPKGVLFFGLPGTGKTLLAKAVANESNATFIKVVATELVQKFIGEGAQYVREIFGLARKKAPTILFIDELDAIASIRMQDDTSGDREVNRTLMQLLSELDGFDERGDIKFIGATNRPDVLDPAILRPGRFDRIVEFPIPDARAREAIFKIHLKKLNFENDIEVKNLVAITNGTTGSDIKGICTEAGMYAIRRNSDIISNDDFTKAIEKIMTKTKNETQLENIFL
ncbi:MAG: proteasome-activating nucleotidase [Candidatus Thorarchaeota archaeon]